MTRNFDYMLPCCILALVCISYVSAQSTADYSPSEDVEAGHNLPRLDIFQSDDRGVKYLANTAATAGGNEKNTEELLPQIHESLSNSNLVCYNSFRHCWYCFHCRVPADSHHSLFHANISLLWCEQACTQF